MTIVVFIYYMNSKPALCRLYGTFRQAADAIEFKRLLACLFVINTYK